MKTVQLIGMPVIRNRRDFDLKSGNWLERLVFNHRMIAVLICAVLTAFLGHQATRLQINASFEKMIPQSHPFIRNYFDNKQLLPGAGNSIHVAVENPQGDIFDKDYLQALQKINDTLYLMKGVDRGWMRGLWTTSLRWTEITEEGYRGGPVMPDPFDGSPQAMDQLRTNIARAGIIGSYVAGNMKSSMIVAPLIELDPDTQKPLDYAAFGRDLEAKLRPLETPKAKIHIIGFAKVVSDLIEGMFSVMMYFAISAAIAALFVFAYTRCIRSTVILVLGAMLGVVWLLGLMELMGYVLDPYLMLVPFLIFAIGLSHGAQKMNGIMQDVGRGTDKYVAARYTFRRLFMAGLTALLTNVVGFAVLMIIDIPVIRDMAIITSVGIAVLIFTKLILIPVLLSYSGVSKAAAARSIADTESPDAVHHGPMMRVRAFLISLTGRRRATAMIVAATAITIAAVFIGQHIQFGDLDRGAPELRPDSRYNRDSAFISENFGLSDDQFVVMMKTPQDQCRTYENLIELDRLGARLRELDGVQTTFSVSDGVRMGVSGFFEGNPKWLAISHNISNLGIAFDSFSADRPDIVDHSCVLAPVFAYLVDHRAETLNTVVKTVEDFAKANDGPDRKFLLAAGNAGIEAVTNIVVRKSFWTMHFVLYGAVLLLCLITFQSWRAIIVAMVPLIITSLLCEALMVVLGIGIKVATLPVIAVGVGVGVDYALYLLSVQLAHQRQGETLAQAYGRSLDFTGRVVGLIGLTMAAGVVTWAWSPIKFQADMGILLTFMFLWNMIGALLLIPALSYFLLRTEADRPGALAVDSDASGTKKSGANPNASNGPTTLQTSP